MNRADAHCNSDPPLGPAQAWLLAAARAYATAAFERPLDGRAACARLDEARAAFLAALEAAEREAQRPDAQRPPPPSQSRSSAQ